MLEKFANGQQNIKRSSMFFVTPILLHNTTNIIIQCLHMELLLSQIFGNLQIVGVLYSKLTACVHILWNETHECSTSVVQ